MDYNPKLKVAADEIKAILKKHDIAAHMVLHTPGHSEHLTVIDPSYSCAFFDMTPGKEGIRVRARLQEDYNGDSAKRNKALSDTSNMLHHLSTTGAELLMGLINTSEMVDKTLESKHNGKGHSGSTQQMN